MDNDDMLLTQLQETGACAVQARSSAAQDMAAARFRADRLGSTLGVRVSAVAGWNCVYVAVHTTDGAQD